MLFSAGLLFWFLFSIMAWAIAACFGGVFSVFSVLTKVGVGTPFTLGGIGHDTLATNRFVEASVVFGHGLSSLVIEAENVVAVVGCCAIGRLVQLGVNWCSSSWNFPVGLGIS